MIQDLSSGSDDVAAAKDTTNASVSVPCVPQSPSGVLDALCLSFKSAETTNANANENPNANANENSANNNSPDAKRMKPNF